MRKLAIGLAATGFLLASCANLTVGQPKPKTVEYLTVSVYENQSTPAPNYSVCIGQEPREVCSKTDVNGNANLNVSNLPPGNYNLFVFPPHETRVQCVPTSSNGSCYVVILANGKSPSPVSVYNAAPTYNGE